jgi:hypothetical protein
MSSPTREFSLEVVKPQGVEGYGLTLTGRPQYRNGTTDISVSIWGRPLQSVVDHVLAALKRAGYSPADLSTRRKKPFLLHEEDGVRLGLLFHAVKPLHKSARIEAISQALRSMEPEEVFYWFSKCATGPDASRARRAFRLLAAEE